ncbi:hypothetical protein [Parasitella parasitica]|uniref:Uncharacterized protein n=1 Tax=Parasitella parasitica TaxID=35722 RepID=A0A0B7NHM8_9FUNG|nr:hypothetical protein [Parasitella parasitica]
MAVGPNDTDLSYRLTESILSRTHLSTTSSASDSSREAPHNSTQQQNQATPRLVGTLPPNSMVIQPKDSNSSFNKYIGNHFKEDAPVLLDRLSVSSPVPPATPVNLSPKKTGSMFWNDLSVRPPAATSDSSLQQYKNAKNLESQNTWLEYDSIFAGQTSSFTTTHFFSAGAFLFLFGFICPPLWWIGSFCPTRIDERHQKMHHSDIKMVKRWRTLNRFFSLGFSTLLIITFIVLAVLYSRK